MDEHMDEDTRLFPEVPNVVGVGVFKDVGHGSSYKYFQALFFDDKASEMAGHCFVTVVNGLMDDKVVDYEDIKSRRGQDLWAIFDPNEDVTYHVGMLEYGGDPIDYYHEFLVERAANEQLIRQQLASQPAYRAGEGSFLLLPDGTLDKGDSNEYYRHD